MNEMNEVYGTYEKPLRERPRDFSIGERVCYNGDKYCISGITWDRMSYDLCLHLCLHLSNTSDSCILVDDTREVKKIIKGEQS